MTASRIKLPLHPDLLRLREKPGMQAALRQLGGAGETSAFAGTLVRITRRGDPSQVGVVLYADAREVDVWLSGSRVRRALLDEVEVVAGEGDSSLDLLAAEVRVFASLRQGDTVRWQGDDGVSRDGTLFEKCRYGGLVATPEGRVLAVGFRRLWPLLTSLDG